MGGKLEELVRQRTQEGRASPPILVPTMAQNTQQQVAGIEQNVQDPLMLLHDGKHLLQQLCGPWQACRVHSTSEAQEQLSCDPDLMPGCCWEPTSEYRGSRWVDTRAEKDDQPMCSQSS